MLGLSFRTAKRDTHSSYRSRICEYSRFSVRAGFERDRPTQLQSETTTVHNLRDDPLKVAERRPGSDVGEMSRATSSP